MKTYSAKGSDIKRSWHLIDAEDQILGRISTQIAKILMGKHKAIYTPNADTGDYVVVINAEKVKLTGDKELQKVYYSHSGYSGGLKQRNVKSVRLAHPERIITHAVKGMIAGNRLREDRMARLKVVAGNQNPYADKFNK